MPHWPAGIVHTEGRGEEKQREKDRKEQGDDDKEIVNLRVPSEGEPACHNKPHCGAHLRGDEYQSQRLSAAAVMFVVSVLNGAIGDERRLARCGLTSLPPNLQSRQPLVFRNNRQRTGRFQEKRGISTRNSYASVGMLVVICAEAPDATLLTRRNW